MRGPSKNPENSRYGRFLSTAVHPDLLKTLKIRAVTEDTTVAELIHAMLCENLNRPDLIEEAPVGRKTVQVS